jgi:hypothetical protein
MPPLRRLSCPRGPNSIGHQFLEFRVWGFGEHQFQGDVLVAMAIILAWPSLPLRCNTAPLLDRLGTFL